MSSARSRRAMAVAPMFFFADFVTCANFSNLCGKFLKTHNRYGHHVSGHHGKNSASWFFQKEDLKKRYFWLFLCLIPYFSELRPNTMSMVSYIVQAFYRLPFGLKMTSKFLSYSVFLGKKEDTKFFEKFFLIPSSFFSKLIKDTEIALFREEQHRYRLLFGPTKLPSSSMTPSFFCQKNFNFFQKNFLVLFNLSSYISWPRPNLGFMVSLVLRGLCRLRFRLKVTSKFFSLWIFFNK